MKIKNLAYAMLCICVAFVISGCGKDTPVQTDSTPAPTYGAYINVPSNAEGTPVPVPTQTEQEPTIAPPDNFEITIYTLNPESLEKEAVSILVTAEDELTPEFIAEQVVEAMEDEGFYIGINDIIIEGESVRLDFKSDAAPVIDVGASVEGCIIDVLAQSILDNLSQYKKIYISIEGGPYHSGHLEFELDDVYLGR